MSYEEKTELYNRFVHKYGRLPTEFDPDYLEMLRMGKYRVLPVPDVSPGKCANCGSSKNDGRQYIDFGLQIDWYGAVFLCGLCLNDIAKSMGLFKDVDEALDNLVVKNETIEQLKDQGASLHESLVTLFKNFEEYYANLHPIRDDSPPDDNSSMEPDKTTVEPRVNASKQRATKSTSSSGSKDVPSFADLLKLEP